jgi:hypothetical protein
MGNILDPTNAGYPPLVFHKIFKNINSFRFNTYSLLLLCSTSSPGPPLSLSARGLIDRSERESEREWEESRQLQLSLSSPLLFIQRMLKMDCCIDPKGEEERRSDDAFRLLLLTGVENAAELRAMIMEQKMEAVALVKAEMLPDILQV